MRLVDLAEHPDDAALARFYNDLIVPAFPSPDELDDLEDWQVGLAKQRQASGGAAGTLGPRDAPHPLDPELHVVIAVEDGTEDGQHHGSLAGARQLGGGVYSGIPAHKAGPHYSAISSRRRSTKSERSQRCDKAHFGSSIFSGRECAHRRNIRCLWMMVPAWTQNRGTWPFTASALRPCKCVMHSLLSVLTASTG